MKSLLKNLAVLDRYIIGELNLAFAFGLGLFSALGIAVGSLFDLLAQVRESRLLFDVALKVMALKMPEFIGFALPMAVLLATLIVYSRLSGDSEIIALRSLGISVYRLVLPALIFSILATAITFVFKDQVIPSPMPRPPKPWNKPFYKNKRPFEMRKLFILNMARITSSNAYFMRLNLTDSR